MVFVSYDLTVVTIAHKVSIFVGLGGCGYIRACLCVCSHACVHARMHVWCVVCLESRATVSE